MYRYSPGGQMTEWEYLYVKLYVLFIPVINNNKIVTNIIEETLNYLSIFYKNITLNSDR